MKKIYKSISTVLFLSFLLTGCATQGETGPQGEQGIPGENGKDGEKGDKGDTGTDGSSVLTGNGEPSSILGNDGDSYIDLETWNYYVKENGSWVLKGNIKGKDGASFYADYGEPDPSLGKDGDSYIDLETLNYYVKENGSWVLKERPNSSSSQPLNPNPILWTGYGAVYTQKFNDTIIEPYVGLTGITVENQSQGSYDKLQSNINKAIGTASYPNFANGYPDHFAGYIASNIQVPLDDYIEDYNATHAKDLIADYYPEYMTENTTLKYKADGTGYIMGLPFNKSTEVMGYNGVFMEYAQSLDNTIKVPETWDEWKVQGPKMLKVMDTLYGKKLYGVEDPLNPDKYISFEVFPEYIFFDKTVLLDCTEVTKDSFRLLTWDSPDNMFITILKQWGGNYTSYTSDDAKKYQHGWAEFASGENRAKTLEAMQFFLDLYNDGIFGLPGNISDSSYSSTAFKTNHCMFTICSSAQLIYNIGSFRFKIAPIPYKDADKKYVISQGTSLGLFDQGSFEMQQKSFDAMVAFTTGGLQGAWAAESGYYPVSKSATESFEYQSFLNSNTSNMTDYKKVMVESAQLNENHYMNSDYNWLKFVDPGFIGSSIIRDEVYTIMGSVFAKENTLENILDESMKVLNSYNPANKK